MVFYAVTPCFPTDIISDILTRLPTETVLECKLVCKTWKNLIQYPSFPQLHLVRLNHPDSIDSGKLRYVYMKSDDDDDSFYPNKYLSYFEFNDNEDWNYAKPIYKKINFKTNCEAYIIIGSFNGLICVYGAQPDSTQGPAIIFNPVTKEYVILPEFDTKGFKSHLACGFGYLASTNEYKVVRIYMVRGEPNSVEVEVYTVGSGKGWRHIGKFDFGFIFSAYPEHTHGVFLNECLHWRNCVGGMVLVFDLAQERFRQHISPPRMRRQVDHEFKVLGVSGGGILYYAVCQSLRQRDFDDVWLLMKKSNDEQEGHQSWGWSKVTSLEQSEPFAFVDDSSTVLRYDEGIIKIFRSTTWEKLVYVNAISCQVFPHKHTLISLKELGEEGAMKSLGISGQINC